MRFISVLLLLYIFLYAETPQLFLLKTYKDDMNLTGWVMSEKFDGVRAFWDGEKLVSRSGRVFTAPKSFVNDFPSFALDGEVWSKRGDFENIVSIVNTKNSGNRWDTLSYMVFEVPKQEGDLFKRLSVIQRYLLEHERTKIKVIEQVKIRSKQEVKDYFNKMIAHKAEGIVIRNPSLPYFTGRRKDALKYKPFIDAECRVKTIIEGRGKYRGQMGTILCEYEGKDIKIGSGFSDHERLYPPSVGSLITFKYYGLTALGNPKYPVFLRIRHDESLRLIEQHID